MFDVDQTPAVAKSYLKEPSRQLSSATDGRPTRPDTDVNKVDGTRVMSTKGGMSERFEYS